MPKLVLASASPRRKELLQRLVPEFTVMKPWVAEQIYPGELPERAAARLALEKATEVAGTLAQPARVIGADTIVVYDGKMLGKPRDAQEAHQMLALLADGWHEVVTGMAVVDAPEGRAQTCHEVTRVHFAPIPETALEAYLLTNEPYDKAGGYGIQGWAGRYIDRIEGCFFNVMGLPLACLGKMLL